MKVLVILQMGLTLDSVELGNKLHLEVTKNSIPKEDEGIAIFESPTQYQTLTTIS